MVRKLAAAILSAGVLVPGLASALGLGEIKLNSALSEPLDAEIQLVQTRELTKDEILAELASSDEFRAAGVERFHYLSDMRFDVVVNTSGRSYIRLKTRKPIKEPFVNFLMEVHWPAGRLLREYTLLLDPPVYSKAPSAITQPAVAAKTQQVQRSTTPRPQTPRQAASTSQVGSAAPLPAGTGSGKEYGPTNSSDSLWAIARTLKPSSRVSIQQTMLAIQRLNPSAFINGNINLLKKGQILRGPTEGQALEYSNREAVRFVAEQNRLWRERRTGARAPSVAEASQIDTSGRSLDSFEKNISKSDGRLKLVTESEGAASPESGSQGGTSEGASSTNRLSDAAAAEEADKFRIENQDLKLRINDVEEQLNTSQKVLELKDDQIAALQARLAELEKQVESATGVAPDPMQEPELESTVEADTEDTSAGIETAEDPAEMAGGEESTGDETTATGEVDYNFTEEKVDQKPVQPIVVEDVKQELVVDEPPKQVQPKEEKSLVEQLTSNPMYLAAGGGVLVLLVALFLIAGRKKKEEDEVDEALVEDFSLEPEAQPEIEDNLVEEDVLGGTEEPEPEEAVAQTADVIGEADIYIAYGRFSQAIEMLENAADNEPGRPDIRVKLLEVCVEANDTESFNKHYAALQSLGDASSIERADALKSRLGGSGDEDLVLPEDSFGSLDEGDSTESDTDLTFDPEPTDTSDTGDVAGLDFNLPTNLGEPDEDDGDTTIVMDVPAEPEAPTTEENELDFSLDFDVADAVDGAEETDEIVGFDASDEVVEEPSVDFSEADESLNLDLDVEDDALDMDLGVADLPDQLEPEEAGAESKSDEMIDSNAAAQLADELELDTDFNLEAGVEEEAAELDESDFTLDADLDMPALDSELPLDEVSSGVTEELPSDTVVVVPPVTGAPSPDDAANEEADLDFLTDADETSTKLDLARAYIDMGDREGAKDILDEVLIEGNGDQQQEAQDLLAKLG